MDEASTHYTVLARRFRPQAFDEVIGQDHVARGLQNAIATGRVAHAYLFTGARGVGKTSMARILAKTLNCPESVEGRPCHECDTCLGIAAGSDVDVLEIDGASNRRIDDIRDLRRNVGVKSMRSQFKIYIIDEVHQLTSEAFNALLKTLEEPPPNVKFIFCTTEPTALPDTILSRCQRFDFGMLSVEQIVERLETIAGVEQVTVDPEALQLVARRATGSMRDSQSLFDQLLASGNERITVEDVHQLLGTAPDELLLSVIGPLVEGEPQQAIVGCEAALAAGVQLEELLGQLLECCRDLMVLAAGAEGITPGSVGTDHHQRLVELARQWGVETAIAAMQVLAETINRSRWTRQSRALADLALVRIATLGNLQGLDAMIAQLSGDTPSPSPSTPPRSPNPQKKTVESPMVTESPVAPQPETTSPPAPTPQPGPQAGPQAGSQPRLQVPLAATIPLETGQEAVVWGRVVGEISDMLRDHVECVDRVAISGPSRLDLVFPAGYHFQKQYCERPEMLARLREVVQKVTGEAIELRLLLAEAEAEPVVESVVGESPAEEITDTMVQEVLDVFGATLERVVPVHRAVDDEPVPE